MQYVNSETIITPNLKTQRLIESQIVIYIFP